MKRARIVPAAALGLFVVVAACGLRPPPEMRILGPTLLNLEAGTTSR